MPRHLILTTAIGYKWDVLRPFFDSLRKSGCKADVVVMTTGLDSMTVENLHRAGARCVKVWRAVHHMPAPIKRRRNSYRLAWIRRNYGRVLESLPLTVAARNGLKSWASTLFLGVMCSRFAWYERFLRKEGHRYDRVILTDLRDVIFQSDPFTWPVRHPLEIFLEDNAFIGEDPMNTGWIEQATDRATVQMLKGRPVSCAGVTIGDIHSMRHYLSVMTNLFVTHGWKFPVEEYIDQGIHNFAIYKPLKEHCTLLRNFSGPVLTMQTIPASALALHPDGALHNIDGSIIPILHQYDRHPAIRDQLLTRFA
jgi:hypothetical protein